MNDRLTGARRALRRWFGPAGLTTRSISDVVAPTAGSSDVAEAHPPFDRVAQGI